jgi:hypothetical protein
LLIKAISRGGKKDNINVKIRAISRGKEENNINIEIKDL